MAFYPAPAWLQAIMREQPADAWQILSPRELISYINAGGFPSDIPDHGAAGQVMEGSINPFTGGPAEGTPGAWARIQKATGSLTEQYVKNLPDSLSKQAKADIESLGLHQSWDTVPNMGDAYNRLQQLAEHKALSLGNDPEQFARWGELDNMANEFGYMEGQMYPGGSYPQLPKGAANTNLTYARDVSPAEYKPYTGIAELDPFSGKAYTAMSSEATPPFRGVPGGRSPLPPVSGNEESYQNLLDQIFPGEGKTDLSAIDKFFGEAPNPDVAKEMDKIQAFNRAAMAGEGAGELGGAAEIAGGAGRAANIASHFGPAAAGLLATEAAPKLINAYAPGSQDLKDVMGNIIAGAGIGSTGFMFSPAVGVPTTIAGGILGGAKALWENLTDSANEAQRKRNVIEANQQGRLGRPVGNR